MSPLPIYVKPVYALQPPQSGQTIIKSTDANGVVKWIPNDPSNADYQQYLKDIALP